MGWRWWRTNQEKRDEVLKFLADHGETLGRKLSEGTRLSRVSCYIFLLDMERDRLVVSRENPGDRERLGGATRFLYRLNSKGLERLKEIGHPLRAETFMTAN